MIFMLQKLYAPVVWIFPAFQGRKVLIIAYYLILNGNKKGGAKSAFLLNKT